MSKLTPVFSKKRQMLNSISMRIRVKLNWIFYEFDRSCEQTTSTLWVVSQTSIFIKMNRSKRLTDEKKILWSRFERWRRSWESRGETFPCSRSSTNIDHWSKWPEQDRDHQPDTTQISSWIFLNEKTENLRGINKKFSLIFVELFLFCARRWYLMLLSEVDRNICFNFPQTKLSFKKTNSFI